MLRISEIFYSIQGESSYAGFPCIFIRLSGCNLSCCYCDTKSFSNKDYVLDLESIICEIKQYNPVKLIEITGGEPLLQNNVYSLINLLESLGYTILLETNGSISVKNVPGFVYKIIDVKCPLSGAKDSFLYENIFYLNKDKDELKFVISDKEDFDFALFFLKEYNLQDFKILLSPVEKKNCEVNFYKEVAEWLLKSKVKARLQLQLHKIIGFK